MPALLHELNACRVKMELQDEHLRNASIDLGLSLQRFRELYRLAPVGFLFIDSNNHITDINGAGKKILGMQVRQQKGNCIDQLVAEEDRSRLKERLDNLLSGNSFTGETVRLSLPDGKRMPVHINGFLMPPLNLEKSHTRLLAITGIPDPDAQSGPGFKGEAPYCCECFPRKDVNGNGVALENRPGNGFCKAREKLRHLSQKTMTLMENERRTIAREIHDSLGGSLAAIKFRIEDILTRNPGDSEISASLNKTVEHIQDTIKRTKQLSAGLRPTTMDDLGLKATIEWFCRKLKKSHPDISFEKSIRMDESAIDESRKIVIYRIIQDAMTHALRHGDADTIHLSVRQKKDRITVTVKDNGWDSDPEGTEATLCETTTEINGYGLTGIKEKTEICGGSFSVNAHERVGTLLRVDLPV